MSAVLYAGRQLPMQHCLTWLMLLHSGRTDKQVVDCPPCLQAAASASARSSWESFGAATPAATAAPAAATAQALEWTSPVQQQQQQQQLAVLPGQQQPQQQPMNEAVVAAAMAAGMTFMQHLQAASGGAQPSPFHDINPLRQAAVAAAAAAAGSPGVSVASQQGAGSGAASPEVLLGGGGAAAAAAAAHQHMIAGMFARMAVGEASPDQLGAAAASLHQHAVALQQQQAVAGSLQASPSGGVQQSWCAFEEVAEPQQQSQSQQLELAVGASPHKLSRLGPGATSGTLPLDGPVALPAGSGIAGWDAMSADDVARAVAIFNKKVRQSIGQCFYQTMHVEGKLGRSWVDRMP